MSKEKYVSIFLAPDRGYCVYYPSTHVETCLRIAHRLPRGMSSLRVFFNDFMNKQKFSFVCNNHTTLSHLKLNFVVIDVRFESWRASRR